MLIGFTFSIAVSKYDQRKNFEEDEANAIGTEYLRAGLLPADDAARVRDLLRNYLDQRISFYETRDQRQLERIDASTAQLQTELWSIVQVRAAATPTPVVALAVSGMNDVLNSQGYTQFGWRNRIPLAAWGLVTAIAVSCNLLIGYGGRQRTWFLLLVLPVSVSVAFFLIADIDSPRRGLSGRTRRIRLAFSVPACTLGQRDPWRKLIISPIDLGSGCRMRTLGFASPQAVITFGGFFCTCRQFCQNAPVLVTAENHLAQKPRNTRCKPVVPAISLHIRARFPPTVLARPAVRTRGFNRDGTDERHS